METVEALDIVVALTSDWLRSEELEPTTLAFAMGSAPSMGLDGLIDEGATAAEEGWAAPTVRIAVLLQALPLLLDTRHMKTALLSAEVT